MDSLKQNWNKYDIEFWNNLPKGDREEWLIHRTACDLSLYFFVKEVGGYGVEAGGNADPIIHKPLCDFWQDRSIRFKFVYMPRFWEKSTILGKWGNIHSYLQNPEERILIPSQKMDLPSTFLRTMKAWIMTNARLRWLYPILIQVDRRWATANPFSSEEVLLPREGHYDAPTFKVIGITGAAQGGHYTTIGPDDLIGEKGMESPTIMEDSFRWFDNIEELLTNPLIDIVRGLGTHWAVGDLGHYIQNEHPKYQWMIVPALKDVTLRDTHNVTWLQNPNVEHDECNWPMKFAEDGVDEPYEEVLRRATQYYHDMRANPQKQMVFYSQQQNNPRASGVTDFREEWLQYYAKQVDENGLIYYQYKTQTGEDREVYLKDLRVKAIIEPASFSEGGMKKGLARFAIVAVGEDRQTNAKLILEAWAKRPKKTEEIYDKIFDIHDKFRPHRWGVETFGQQGFILKSIREEARKRGIHLNISSLPKDVRKDAKGTRIRSLTDDFSSMQIYLHKSMRDFIVEYLSYPIGQTKDLLDALSYHKEWWSKVKRGDIEKSNQERYQALLRRVNPGVH